MTELTTDEGTPWHLYRFAALNIRDRTATIESEAVVTFVDGGALADTITRPGGSFVTEGFVAGQTLTVTSPLNKWSTTIVTVAALTLTLDTGIVAAEVGVAARLHAVETKATWKASVAGAFTTENRRLGACAGSVRLPNRSTAIAWNLRRPLAFAAAARYWKHDMSDSLQAVELGALDDATIREMPVAPMPTANYGELGEYEETVDGTLDSLGFVVAQEHGGHQGVFICHPHMRAPVGSVYNRWHGRSCVDLAAEVVQTVLKKKLGARLALDPGTGYMAPAQRKSLEECVLRVLADELLRKPVGAVPRVAGVTFELSATDDLRASAGSRVVHWLGVVTGQGYAEDFDGYLALE